MVHFRGDVFFEALPDFQRILFGLFVVPGQAVKQSRPCLPIHSEMNEACSLSDFFEYGPVKIRLQYCLNFANSSAIAPSIFSVPTKYTSMWFNQCVLVDF